MTDAHLKPRLCHLLKWPDFNGYGFNLHAEKGKAGQYIGKVDPGSPAEAAGLKDGDRIVEVNGTNIGNENHQQVVGRIKAGGDKTNLLVVDKETDQHYKDEKKVVRGDLPEVDVRWCPSHDTETSQEDVPPSYNDVTEEAPVSSTHVETVQSAVSNSTTSQYIPRLCHMKKRQDFNGYGFNLHAERDKPGQYIGQIDDNSPAQHADLREGDRIVEVNGTNIESESHQRVIELVKSGGDETRMLVVDKETDEYFKSQGVTVSSSMSEVRHTSSVKEEEQVSAVVESPPPVFNIPPPPTELPPQAEEEEEDEDFNVDELRDLGNQDEAVEETVEAVQSAEVEAEVPAPEDYPPPPEDELVEHGQQIEDEITAEVAETAESAFETEEITTTAVSDEFTEKLDEITQNSEEVSEETIENAVHEVQESLPSETFQKDVETTQTEVAEVAEDVQAAVEENNVSEVMENVSAESEKVEPTLETTTVNSTEASVEPPAVEPSETPVETPAEPEKPAVEPSETPVESEKPAEQAIETPVENATESVMTNGHSETASETPAETASETLAETAPEKPAEAVEETTAEKHAEIVETPADTVQETPADKPAESIADKPAETVEQTPTEAPKERAPAPPAQEPIPEPPAETAPVKPIKEVESSALNGSTTVTETVTSYTAPEPTPAPTPAPVSQPEPAPAPKQANGTGDPIFGMSAAEMKERLKSKKKVDPRSANVGFIEKHKLFERM